MSISRQRLDALKAEAKLTADKYISRTGSEPRKSSSGVRYDPEGIEALQKALEGLLHDALSDAAPPTHFPGDPYKSTIPPRPFLKREKQK